jgi:hypothetical protein
MGFKKLAKKAVCFLLIFTFVFGCTMFAPVDTSAKNIKFEGKDITVSGNNVHYRWRTNIKYDQAKVLLARSKKKDRDYTIIFNDTVNKKATSGSITKSRNLAKGYYYRACINITYKGHANYISYAKVFKK